MVLFAPWPVRWVSVSTHTAPVRTDGPVCGQCSSGCEYTLILPPVRTDGPVCGQCSAGCQYPLILPPVRTDVFDSAALGVSIHSYCVRTWSCLWPVQRWVSVSTRTAPVRTDGPVCGQCSAGCQYTLILPL